MTRTSRITNATASKASSTGMDTLGGSGGPERVRILAAHGQVLRTGSAGQPAPARLA